MPLVDPGRKAPVFTLEDQDGTKHALKDLAGKWVVLYFYPKDDTSGCTAEACQFRDNLEAFESADVAVLGVSPDSLKSHAKFVDKFDLTFPLLADEDHAVAEKYGVWRKKKMMGKTYMGIVRSTFIIDKEGTLVAAWDKVKADGHAEEVLAWVFADCPCS